MFKLLIMLKFVPFFGARWHCKSRTNFYINPIIVTNFYYINLIFIFHFIYRNIRIIKLIYENIIHLCLTSFNNEF